MNQSRHRSGTFHRIGQPDVKGEHGTLTCTTDEHQHQGSGNEETSSGNFLADGNGKEGCGSSTILDVRTEVEVERVCKISKDEDAHQEEHIGKASDDEGFLGSCDSSRTSVIETDEEIRRHTYQFPEKVHLEDVGRQHQSKHRHSEEAQIGIVALETTLTVHITEGVEMHHQRHSRDDHEHHHRDGIEEHTKVEVQATQRQPSEVERHYRWESAVSKAFSSKEILISRCVRQYRHQSQRNGTDKSCCFMTPHLSCFGDVEINDTYQEER